MWWLLMKMEGEGIPVSVSAQEAFWETAFKQTGKREV